MRVSFRLDRKFRLLVIGTLVISALAASPVLARGNRPRSGSGLCWVTPNPVSNDVVGQFTVFGSGFTPGQMLDVFIGGAILMAQADSAGNWATWDWAQFFNDGTQTVYVYQMGDRHMTVLASCSFQVS